MNPQTLNIKIAESVKAAPIYDPLEYTSVDITEALIVKAGTVGGSATIDFIMVDNAGNEYVSMLTAGVVEGLAAAIKGAKENG